MRGVPYVDVTRGALVESVHAVIACACDSRGDVVLAYGDIDAPIYLRSTAKPFIAACVVASGAAERFAFDEREIALVAASHNGEVEHATVVAGMLRKIGLDERALRCGTHPPSYEPAASALARSGDAPSARHNNCSGKHAGILALCVHLGFDVRTYLAIDHPAQQAILAFCARLCEEDLARMRVAVDGCGIAVFATSMRRAARAFARLASPERLPQETARALDVVRAAMAAQPYYVAGTGRFDSALPVATRGAIVGKIGAEGVHGDAICGLGLGLALKVVDGAQRAVAPATVALLTELGALDATATAELADFAAPAIANVAGDVVGGIVAGADTIAARSTS
ncbi:MAG: asparaginase [Vulcanimicrobiaceae bacterium]